MDTLLYCHLYSIGGEHRGIHPRMKHCPRMITWMGALLHAGVVPATSRLPNRPLHHILYRSIVSILQHRSRSHRN